MAVTEPVNNAVTVPGIADIVDTEGKTGLVKLHPV
jgi:hypothetical protein